MVSVWYVVMQPQNTAWGLGQWHIRDSRHRGLSENFNLLKPNDIYIYIYICRTAALTSRRYILNIYSTNIHTEYFKHAA